MGRESNEHQQVVNYAVHQIPRLKARVRRARAIGLVIGIISCAMYLAEAASAGEVLLAVAVCYFGTAAITETCQLHIDTLAFRRADAVRREEEESVVTVKPGCREEQRRATKH